MKKQFIFIFVALVIFGSMSVFAQEEVAMQDFTLINQTGVVIHHVYLSPHSEDTWGEDVLGKDVFESDSETAISFAPVEDICLWDLMIDDSEGNAITWGSIDLCQWYTVTLHWDGETATATFE